jgi:hypothetical protein
MDFFSFLLTVVSLVYSPPCNNNWFTSVLKVKIMHYTALNYGINRVKPDHAVTCIKRTHYSFPVIENSIWIEPLLRGHMSCKATFSLSQSWPPNTGLTVCTKKQCLWTHFNFFIFQQKTTDLLYELATIFLEFSILLCTCIFRIWF